MEYKVDGWNNFCRVFVLPEKFSTEFCFGGGIVTNFVMVDWFNPVPNLSQSAVSKKIWRKEVGQIEIKTISHDELVESLVPWLQKKSYVREHEEYLILCDFGAAIKFKKE